MNNRRDFIRNSILTTGGLSLASQGLAANNAAEPPMRFIFIHKSNGTIPGHVALPSLSNKDKEAEKKKNAFEVDLTKHDLPEWMSALEAHKKDMAIVQGISGKMCTTGHHTWCSALGAYKANERISSIKWATVDFELAKLFPSPMEHIELACFPGTGGGNPRGNLNGIEKGFSARAAQQPNYAFGSPKVALNELFKSVVNSQEAKVKYQMERQLLEFTMKNQAALTEGLSGIEKAKVANYAESLYAMNTQNKKIDAMASTLRKHIPKLDEKYLKDDLTTVDRQLGHTEVLLSSLISGLTNVIAFTVDELGTTYTGLPGLEKVTVGLHDVGHNKSFGGVDAKTIRTLVKTQHVKLIDIIVKRLKSVREGRGTMFDNTTIFYFPENGEAHHSHGTEYPFVILSGSNSKLNLGGRYLRLPYWKRPGHKTLGNLWTTVLNAYGNPIKHYGDFDLALKGNQSGPIKHLV